MSAAGFGAAYGLLPIGWIVLNIIFMYQLTLERGQFAVLRDSIAGIVDDSRLQLLLIAFCFGAFFEGAAGFGTPVAVTGAMLIGLGFAPLQAAGLSLIANTAPVAFGALGTPLVTLAGVTNLPLQDLSSVVGRMMTPFALLVPFWLLVAYCGWRRTLQVWPAVLVVGVSFSVTQLLISNLHGPWLTAIGASLVSIASLVLLLRVWKPAQGDAGRRQCRCRAGQCAGRCCADWRRAAQGVDAVDHPHGAGVRVGPARRQGLARRDLPDIHAVPGPAPAGAAHAAGGCRAAAGSGDAQPQPAVGHRHGNPACRRDIGPAAGRATAADCCHVLARTEAGGCLRC